MFVLAMFIKDGVTRKDTSMQLEEMDISCKVYTTRVYAASDARENASGLLVVLGLSSWIVKDARQRRCYGDLALWESLLEGAKSICNLVHDGVCRDLWMCDIVSQHLQLHRQRGRCWLEVSHKLSQACQRFVV